MRFDRPWNKSRYQTIINNIIITTNDESELLAAEVKINNWSSRQLW